MAKAQLSTQELSGVSGVPRTTPYRYFKGADMRGSAVEAVDACLQRVIRELEQNFVAYRAECAALGGKTKMRRSA